MKELRKDDEVWVIRTLSVDCSLVEPELAKKPTEAQKLAERTMKAMWAANDAVNERPPSVEPPGHLVMEAEIKIEGKEYTPPTTTSKHYHGPDISKVTFQFTQSPNTLGTTDPTGGVGSEDITIDCEYQLPGEEPFFVIRSDSGWSFDDPESFLKLLLSVKEAEEKCRCSLPQS